MSNVAAVLEGVRRAMAQGRADQAKSALRRALQADGGDPDLNNAMAVVLAQSGEKEQALYFADKALARRAGSADFHSNRARILSGLSRTDDAVGAFERALTTDPTHDDAARGLLETLRAARRNAEAGRRLAAASARASDNVGVGQLAVRALIDGGLGAEAGELAARLAAEHPGDHECARLAAFYGNYLSHADPAEQRAAHARFGELVGRMLPQEPVVYGNARDPDRRIKVGVLSPDLRHSAVAFFIEPFFEHRDRAGVELLSYSCALRHDELSDRFKATSDGWVHAPDWSDFDLAKRIRADGVDVLLDLAGLTRHNRLGVLALRAAPVQATYLGYPNTTGLATVDYRITDSTTDPAGSEAACVERLARIDPCFLCYRPPAYAPDVQELPATDGPITFGSFNSLLKFNRATAAAWAGVLRAVPGSRLVMKAIQLDDPVSREETMRTLAGAGIDSGRVELLRPLKGPAEHLSAYAPIDVALDTYPYGGTTTTCEALLMGVPVVTLAGPVHASRVGASVLHAAGLGDLVARSPEEFARIGAALAGDRARREELRRSMRQRLRGSVLCDGPAFSRRLEGALRTMWSAWCRGEGGACRG